VRIDGISDSPFIHVRAKTRFYCRNHTKNYFCSTLMHIAGTLSTTVSSMQLLFALRSSVLLLSSLCVCYFLSSTKTARKRYNIGKMPLPYATLCTQVCRKSHKYLRRNYFLLLLRAPLPSYTSVFDLFPSRKHLASLEHFFETN